MFRVQGERTLLEAMSKKDETQEGHERKPPKVKFRGIV